MSDEEFENQGHSEESGPPAKSTPPKDPPKPPIKTTAQNEPGAPGDPNKAPPAKPPAQPTQQAPAKPPAQQQAPQQQQRPPAPPPANRGQQPDNPNAKKELPPPPRPKPSTGKSFKRSESLVAFATALAKAQGEMDLASKDAHNPFFHSYYADMASVVGALRGPFSKNGLSFMQFPRATDEGVEVETIILHESGEWVSDVLALPTMKIDPQGYGQAISYCCRYAIRSMAGVAAEEDDGNKPTADVQKARSETIDKLTAAALQSAEAFEAAFKELTPELRKAVQRDLPQIRAKIPGASPPPSAPARSASVI